MKPLLILNIVGLTTDLLGKSTPNLNRLKQKGGSIPIGSMTPAVTCSVQATYLTGQLPSQHGIVGNGWYNRNLAEISFWKQSRHLIQAPLLWDKLKQKSPETEIAQLFWWYNMYCGADYSATPRPMYPADGRKIPDIYTHPAKWREELQEKYGQFPLFNFWGPTASIKSSQWIANATIELLQHSEPGYVFVYLPHLDYNLQRLGPHHPDIQKDLLAVDTAAGEIIDAYEDSGYNIMALSEYGITTVDRSIPINRYLREEGLLAVRTENNRELLDAGACQAFAVADHQVAHIYINNHHKTQKIHDLLKRIPGIETILTEKSKKSVGLDHERAGDLVAISDHHSWFNYYYWLHDSKSPDFATTVDIHRKPGYDPVELFLDPKIRFPLLKLGSKLAKKKLGMRTLMDVIPLDTGLVKGSHGRPTDQLEQGPVLISSAPHILPDRDLIPPEGVKDLILKAGPAASMDFRRSQSNFLLSQQ